MSIEESAAKVVKLIERMNRPSDGLTEVSRLAIALETSESLPAIVEIVTEARKFASIVTQVCAATHPGDMARRFLDFTAPIVEQGETR